MSKFVRLKPYNPRRGYVVQRHGIGEMFFVGGVRPNWYEVQDVVAERLAKKRQFHNDPDSKPLFDIMDREEKERVAAEEQNQVLAHLGAVGQTVLMPPSVKEPKTVDLTDKGGSPPPVPGTSAEASQAVGRAAAIPQPRTPRRMKTRGGTVVGPDVAGTTNGSSGDGDGAGEG